MTEDDTLVLNIYLLRFLAPKLYLFGLNVARNNFLRFCSKRHFIVYLFEDVLEKLASLAMRFENGFSTL
jgi:hypothetical protein